MVPRPSGTDECLCKLPRCWCVACFVMFFNIPQYGVALLYHHRGVESNQTTKQPTYKKNSMIQPNKCARFAFVDSERGDGGRPTNREAEESITGKGQSFWCMLHVLWLFRNFTLRKTNAWRSPLHMWTRICGTAAPVWPEVNRQSGSGGSNLPRSHLALLSSSLLKKRETKA